MDLNELRRLSQDGAKRVGEEQQRKVQEQQAANELKRKELWETEWTRAREAVNRLDGTLKTAASKGQRSAEVYRTEGNEFFPVGTRPLKPKPRYGSESEDFISAVPAYAQYVFDACPHELNPRWVILDYPGGLTRYHRICIYVDW